MVYNFYRVLEDNFLKTCFIPRLLDHPTDCCNTTHMIFLAKISWNSIGTKAFCNHSPNRFCYRTLKEEMRDVLMTFTEIAFGISFPFLLIKLSLVKIALLAINHIKILIFAGTFPFQIIL